MSHNFHTYLLLKPGTDYKKLEGKFTEYIEKYCLPQLKQILHTNSIADFQKQGDKIEYDLTPLTKIHLYSNLQYEIRPGGDIQYVYIFSAVAIFILVIACINFMNLTTARSANRAKEVGIRKVLGTVKKDLIAQFLVECTLMVFISLLLAIGIAALILPVFNEVASKSMRFSSLFSSMLLPLLIVLPFAVGLLAGSYPAFFLSSFQPIAVLKGRINRGSGSLRSLLVVFQFTTSIILIIGTIVIYRQLHYIQTKNLGFNKNEVLIINGTDALGSNVDAFKTEMLKMTGVKSGTISGFLPVNSSNRSDDVFSLSSVMDTKNSFDMQVWGIDEDYLPTMEMQLIKGRNFSKSFGTDSGAVVINETAAGYFQGADPLGQKLYSGYFANNNSIRPYTVIGVVKNFNFESLKQNVGPLGFFLRRNPGLVSFKVNAANSPDIVKLAENKWKDLAPGMPFSYRFMDNAFNDMYKVEQRIGKIILIFSTIAIAIACLGLFGLSTFIAEQRTKEIGIRKALGSSVSGIVQLLSRDFMRLVAISFIIAAPFAWWFMNKWLQDFANRTSLSWWIFLLSGTIALAIALFTVSFQAIRAAMMNPVRSLRTE
jgi:putative ABC transport system permease protein